MLHYYLSFQTRQTCVLYMVIYCKMLQYASEISSFIKIILDRTNLVFIPTLTNLVTLYILCLTVQITEDNSTLNILVTLYILCLTVQKTENNSTLNILVTFYILCLTVQKTENNSTLNILVTLYILCLSIYSYTDR